MGNNFQEIVTLEKVIKVFEIYFEGDPSGTNRSKIFKAQSELNLQLGRERVFKEKSSF